MSESTMKVRTAISLLHTTPDTFSLTSNGPLFENNLSVPENCMILDTSSWSFIPWDNPDNIISQQTQTAVDTAIDTVCLPLLFLTSVPSNILNMLVFWKQGLKERINLCLFSLSSVDFCHMLNAFFLNVDRFIPPFTNSIGPVYEFIIDHKLIGLRAFIWLSGFISMLIACERCLCVVSPLRSQTILKTRTTAGILVVASVLIVTASMMMGLRLSLICVFDPVTKTSSKSVFSSQFYRENKVFMDALTFFMGTPLLLTYIFVVSVTTVVTAVKLKQMVAWREQASSSTLSPREAALTRALIGVSCLYVVCSVPSIITGVGVLFVPDFSISGRYYNFTRLFVSLLELASYVNATFNFFVYCFLGTKYKETLGVLCSGIVRRQKH